MVPIWLWLCLNCLWLNFVNLILDYFLQWFFCQFYNVWCKYKNIISEWWWTSRWNFISLKKRLVIYLLSYFNFWNAVFPWLNTLSNIMKTLGPEQVKKLTPTKFSILLCFITHIFTVVIAHLCLLCITYNHTCN